MNFRLPVTARRLAAVLPSFLPSSCALCGADGGSLCPDCGDRFFRRGQPRCLQCAVPMTQGGEHCGACLKHPPAFDRTIAAADYAPPVDQMVLALKFGGKLALAPLFAHLLKQAMADLPPELRPDLLTAVPLGPHRLRERGFNQALEIARPLARAMNVELAPQLAVRTRDTAAQSLLHPDERRANVRGAFVAPASALERIRGRHVGVVDDVATTGDTLDELAATLKRFGAARVTNLVFARTPLK